MDSLLNTVANLGSWIWSYPLLIMIVVCGVLFSIRLGFFKFTNFHIL